MARVKAKHPLLIRLTHWLNGPVLAIMIWSGLRIYWANDEYAIRINGTEWIKFFPDWVYETFGLKSSLAQGMAWHFAFAWFFAINGFLYVGYTIWSGYWRELMPNLKTPREALQVMLHDLKLRKELPPQGTFNAAQKLAYCGVIAMGAGSLITGLAIYKPTQLSWLANLCGGYTTARLLHFVLTLGYLLFFVIHITQVIKAGWNNFRAMVTGYELTPTPETPHDGTNGPKTNAAPATGTSGSLVGNSTGSPTATTSALHTKH